MEKLVVIGMEPTQGSILAALEKEIKSNGEFIRAAMQDESDLYAGIVEGDIVISTKWTPKAFVRAYFCEGKEMYCKKDGYQIFKYDLITTRQEFVKYVYPIRKFSIKGKVVVA